jgi:hypothetical protein
MKVPDWLLNGITSGIFALAASFAGAWAAFKLQRLHERKTDLQKEMDSYLRIYKVLQDQQFVMEHWDSRNTLKFDHVAYLDLDQKELYRLLSRRTYRLIRDIILAREGYVKLYQTDSADPAEIEHLKTLTASVVRDLDELIDILRGGVDGTCRTAIS